MQRPPEPCRRVAASVPVTPKRPPSAVIELPNDCEIVAARALEAPIAVVLDAFTTRDRAEMAVSEGEDLTVYTNDLWVGGTWHHVSAGDDGTETSFHGTFLAVERPTRVSATRLLDDWPEAEAVESIELNETDGITMLTYRLAFRDPAARDTIPKEVSAQMMGDGFVRNIESVAALLRSRVDPSGMVPG